ncbi:hypothetical protein AB4Y43_40730, partial [Paraburkholderia sp. BR10872]|uniref:hypothetical protein n=1 Tax=Paraburkholderia sp. BR10872 TaxID=3236989 RepID=UPI0034D27E07
SSSRIVIVIRSVAAIKAPKHWIPSDLLAYDRPKSGHLNLAKRGCGGILGLLGAGPCIHTKNASERSNST